MLIFGHIGITLLIAFLIFKALKIETNRRLYLFVILGSILPDLIDKPIGEILLAESLSHGRLFAHSLLFIFILLVIGIYIYKQNKEKGFIFLSFASLIHLYLDDMWLDPETLFFPLFGFHFQQGIRESHWLDYFLNIFYNHYYLSLTGSEISSIFIAELIGIFIISIFILRFNHI